MEKRTRKKSPGVVHQEEEQSSKPLEIREFEIDKIPLSCTWVIIGAPKSGKGTLMENIMFFNKHRIPVAKIFTGSETQYERFKRITHPLYVLNSYDNEAERKYIARQRQCKLDGNKMYNSINILDDIGDNPKIFKSDTFLGLFKIGTQHWNHVLLLANQYAIDLPPSIRKSVSFIALFREPNFTEREKLFKNFGGICGSFEMFCHLMDKITGDYTCMIIYNAGNQSNKLEDCIFWYRTTPIEPNWKFGCDEYHKWAEARYNKNYKEVVLM